MKQDRHVRGQQAEAWAEAFLKSKGLTILDKNYRCRFGEIDLICQRKNTLIFVEVRLRTHTGYGDAAESIHFAKQRKLLTAARHYLRASQSTLDCRFDAIVFNKADPNAIEWIQNAFDATDFE